MAITPFNTSPKDLTDLNNILVDIGTELRRLDSRKLNITAFNKYLPLFTKGDLLVTMTGERVTRLPVGADNSVLMADSTQLPGVKWTSAVHLTNSTYTPTLNNVANLDASTAYACQYLRVGNTVTVSGKVDMDPTAAAATQLGISLPIASNFAAAEQCGGTAFCPAVGGQGAGILGDAANNRAELNGIVTDVNNQSWYFTFTYLVV